MSKNKNKLVDLSDHDILRVDGPDAAKFLQGQLSCDLTLVTEQMGQLGACCNLKGRIVANFVIIKFDSAYLLICHAGLGEILLNVLKKYAVFSKVDIQISNNDLILLGLIEEQNQSVKTEPTLRTKKIYWPTQTETQAKFAYLVGQVEHLKSDWPLLKQQYQLTGRNAWNLALVQAAIAFIKVDHSEIFTPQAINFELVYGINFKKGCYTGQEVIARLHYKGSSKRRLYIASSTQSKLMDTGTLIMDSANKSIGQVLDSAWNAQGEQLSLVSIPVTQSKDKPIYFNDKESAHLRLAPPPYAIPKESSNSMGK